MMRVSKESVVVGEVDIPVEYQGSEIYIVVNAIAVRPPTDGKPPGRMENIRQREQPEDDGQNHPTRLAQRTK